MEKLKQQFNKIGFEFKMIERSEKAVIYAKWCRRADNSDMDIYDYETHKVRVLPLQMRKFKQLDGSYKEVLILKHEHIASTEEFGIYGWSYFTLENAKKRFNRINRQKD